MPIKEPSGPERAEELTDIARQRAPREQSPFRTGPELIGIGFGLLLLAAIVGGLLAAASQGTSSTPLAVVVSALGGFAGLMTMLAGVIRWGVEPLIHFEKKRVSQRRRKRRKQHKA